MIPFRVIRQGVLLGMQGKSKPRFDALCIDTYSFVYVNLVGPRQERFTTLSRKADELC
jgi:hypothetical protein